MDKKTMEKLVKAAYIEGWKEGHLEGIGCGHSLSGRCNHDHDCEWNWSDVKENIATLDWPREGG